MPHRCRPPAGEDARRGRGGQRHALRHGRHPPCRKRAPGCAGRMPRVRARHVAHAAQ